MKTCIRELRTNTVNKLANLCLLTLVVLFSCKPLLAGGGPENVILVINADSASSKMIGNYYIEGRKIPARNVIYLNGIAAKETTRETTFKEKILEPILEEIEARKLVGTVDYIIYSSDFPTMVNIDKHFTDLRIKLKKETGQILSPKLYAPRASLTAMTYFAGATQHDNPGYIALDSNTYYRIPASKILTNPFMGETQAKYQQAIENFSGGTEDEIDGSIKILEEILKKNPQQVAAAYWLARRYGQKGDARSARNALFVAVRLGWKYKKYIQSDQAFEQVKSDPLFKSLLDQIPDMPFDFAPTRGFKNKYSWGKNGFLNIEPGQGNRYFISSVLAVTRNHGNTEKEALRQLKRSMAADGTHPKGTFYFTDTEDVRVTTRKPNYGKAIAALEAMGHKTEIVSSKMPVKARDVIGLTCGTAQFNWTATGSKIVPGAFCDNLTSYAGALHRPGQTKISVFLANGAAGASGTIVEPYAIQNKFPHPMIHVHYARGCSLGEAFYQSVYGPFQTLLLGDALCQPWAKKPELVVTGIKPDDEIKDKVKINLDASKSPVPVVGYELLVDGVVVHRTKLKDSLTFDSTGMSDGYHEIRVVAIANNPMETSQSIILPVRINNLGHSTTLTTEHKDYLDTDTIKFSASSNQGDSIELMHNGRSIAKSIGQKADFEIPAKLLGRGPVTLEALAISESGKSVASWPLKLQIDGLISERKVDTETKPKPKKAAKPKSKK